MSPTKQHGSLASFACWQGGTVDCKIHPLQVAYLLRCIKRVGERGWGGEDQTSRPRLRCSFLLLALPLPPPALSVLSDSLQSFSIAFLVGKTIFCAALSFSDTRHDLRCLLSRKEKEVGLWSQRAGHIWHHVGARRRMMSERSKFPPTAGSECMRTLTRASACPCFTKWSLWSASRAQHATSLAAVPPIFHTFRFSMP